MFCSDCAESMSDTLSVINTRASAFDRPCVYQSAAAAAQHSLPPQRQKNSFSAGDKSSRRARACPRVSPPPREEERRSPQERSDKGRQGGTGKPPGQKRACPNGGKRGRPTAPSPSARFWRGGNSHLLFITPSQKAQGARQRLAMPLRFLRWCDICESWGKRCRGDVSRDDGRVRPPPAAAGGRPWRGG